MEFQVLLSLNDFCLKFCVNLLYVPACYYLRPDQYFQFTCQYPDAVYNFRPDTEFHFRRRQLFCPDVEHFLRRLTSSCYPRRNIS